MNPKSVLAAVVMLILGLVLILPHGNAAEPSGEEARIKALLSHVASLETATFIRNGKDYKATDAAEFLRRKWGANKESIKTASDFIKVAATKSSTTGKPYLIRFKDGKEVPCGEYLMQRLKAM